MGHIGDSSVRRFCIAFTATAALALSPAGASAQDCAGADAAAYPNPGGSADVVVCLINRERAAQGLHLLSVSPALNRAAVEHSRDMVANHFLAHTSPWRGSLLTRVRTTGWLRRTTSYHLGENLGYIDLGATNTPAHILAMWMASPLHRANLLNAGYRSIGLAVLNNTPAGGAGSTYTAEFGVRRFPRNLASKPVP
jgi:uncharacterized protein YkwD